MREKKTSTAEVDYIHSWNSKLIPIEVKSGTEGKLKSLHLFMENTPHKMAIRFYAGELQITDVITATGKNYKLLNMPYYLVSQLENYLTWFQKEIENK